MTVSSCKKENLNGYQRPSNLKFGEIHNKILDLYYKNKTIALTFEDKIAFVDKNLAENMANIRPGTFVKIVNNYPNLKSYLHTIYNSNANIHTANYLIQNMYDKNQITFNEKNLLLQIGQIYESHIFDFDNLKSQLLNLKNSINNNSHLDENEKYNINSVLNVSISSIEYWALYYSRNHMIKSAPWYEKDFFGAMLGIQSGLVGWAGSFLGPYGAAGALVGSLPWHLWLIRNK